MITKLSLYYIFTYALPASHPGCRQESLGKSYHINPKLSVRPFVLKP